MILDEKKNNGYEIENSANRAPAMIEKTTDSPKASE